jgi:hypothetical protein
MLKLNFGGEDELPNQILRSPSTLLCSMKIKTQSNVFISVSELIFVFVEKIPIGVPPDWRTAACNDHGV